MEKLCNQILESIIAIRKDLVRQRLLLKNHSNTPLTEQQVLEMLGIGAKTLRSYRTNGLLAYSKIGNKFFYRQSDIDKMLDNARIVDDYN